MKELFGQCFRNNWNSLVHAIQDDSFSCGIITANTIEHCIFNCPLVDSAHVLQSRLSWFSRLASSIIASLVSNPKPLDITNRVASKHPSRAIANLLNPSDFVASQHPPQAIVDLLNPLDFPQSPTSSDDSEFESTEDSTSEFEEDVNSSTTTPMDTNPYTTIAQKLLVGTFAPSPPSGSVSVKRARMSDEESEDETDDSSKTSRKYVKAGEGKSRSAIASRSQRKNLKEGTFVVNKAKY